MRRVALPWKARVEAGKGEAGFLRRPVRRPHRPWVHFLFSTVKGVVLT